MTVTQATTTTTVSGVGRPKSGGPSTTAGKHRSRRNALKHGMTGKGRVLPPDLQLEVLKEREIFHNQFQPRDDYETDLVDQAALASVRMRRLAEAEVARTAIRVLGATDAWDEQRLGGVDAWYQRLDDEPAEAVRQLRRTSEGHDALLDAWDELLLRLEQHGFWNDSQATRALHLLGLASPPECQPDADDSSVGMFWKAILALQFHSQPERFDGREPSRFDALRRDLPTLERARTILHEFVARQQAELAERGDFLWEHYDRPDRDGAPTRALFDPSPEGARLHRYLNEAERVLRRSLDRLEKNRNARAQSGMPLNPVRSTPTESVQAPPPEPPPSPEPTPTPTPTTPDATAPAPSPTLAPSSRNDRPAPAPSPGKPAARNERPRNLPSRAPEVVPIYMTVPTHPEPPH